MSGRLTRRAVSKMKKKNWMNKTCQEDEKEENWRNKTCQEDEQEE